MIEPDADARPIVRTHRTADLYDEAAMLLARLRRDTAVFGDGDHGISAEYLRGVCETEALALLEKYVLDHDIRDAGGEPL